VRSRTSANVISARVDPEPTAAKRGKPTLAPPRPLRGAPILNIISGVCKPFWSSQ
jgi:hypothetical protein